MDKSVKKNIRLFAEKYKHTIEYDKDVMLLKSKINQIKVWVEDKYGVNIALNKGQLITDIKVDTHLIYDALHQIFIRNSDLDAYKRPAGILITLDEWINEEGEFAEEQIQQLKKQLADATIDYKHLGGNRFIAEFYKGVVILTDDLSWAATNIVHL
ncbi:MAG: hypothetical protein AAFX87_00095 [Bacteroidota bacterium]